MAQRRRGAHGDPVDRQKARAAEQQHRPVRVAAPEHLGAAVTERAEQEDEQMMGELHTAIFAAPPGVYPPGGKTFPGLKKTVDKTGLLWYSSRAKTK